MTWDGDLLALVPNVRPLLFNGWADVQVCTHGSASNGVLSHPSVWHSYRGMVAYWGSEHPHKPDAYWTDRPVVWCSVAQMFRDCWAHDYAIVFNGRWLIWDSTLCLNEKMALLSDARGARPLSRHERGDMQRAVYGSVEAALRTLAVAVCPLAVAK